MFTGIVEEPGIVVRIRPGRKSTELTIRTGQSGKTLRAGNSIAVNGACLTVVKKRGPRVAFDVLNETLRCTNFGELKTGSLVNLERPLRADGRLDGHFVQGHVDATGVIRRWEQVGKDYVLEVAVPAGLRKYIVAKGSIAVDGISLTVASVGRDWIVSTRPMIAPVIEISGSVLYPILKHWRKNSLNSKLGENVSLKMRTMNKKTSATSVKKLPTSALLAIVFSLSFIVAFAAFFRTSISLTVRGKVFMFILCFQSYKFLYFSIVSLAIR